MIKTTMAIRVMIIIMKILNVVPNLAGSAFIPRISYLYKSLNLLVSPLECESSN